MFKGKKSSNEPSAREQFESAIRQLIPISDLSPSIQNKVINTAEVIQFKKKDFVFKEGDEDNFSFYILSGELDLLTNKQWHDTVVGGTDRARYAMAQLLPRQFSAKAKTPVTILKLNRGTLDRFMVLEGGKDGADDSLGVSVEEGVGEAEGVESGDWMTKILQSDLFSQLPMANIQKLFVCLETITFGTGEAVIKQGDPGDKYYIIQEGRCEVLRAPSDNAKPIKLAELSVGDSFGEEALLTDAKRNATIVMMTPGTLGELSKKDFIDLVKEPTLAATSFDEARQLVSGGAQWVDVRFVNEFKESHIEGSVNIPHSTIRIKSGEFDKDKQYVLYCDTGGRSSSAAFLLASHGLHVTYLQGGLAANPKALGVTLKEEKPKQIEDKVNKEQAELADKEVMDAAVQASMLEADLAKNQMEIQAAEELNERGRQADEELRKRQGAERKRLAEEKKEIEQQKKIAEAEIAKKRQQEEEKILRFKKNAEVQMQADKEKLEKAYSKSTEEMGKLQAMKDAYEAKLKAAYAQVEKQKAAAAQGSAQSRDLGNKIEAEKKKLEQEATRKRAEYEEREKNLKAKAKALLDQERRELAEKIARSNAELEKAKREKAAAEAARVAAKQEAQNIIEEYKLRNAREQAASTPNQAGKVNQVKTVTQPVAKQHRVSPVAKEEAEKLRKQMDAELAEWKKTADDKEKQFAKVESQAEHMQRIRQRASAAKKEAEKAIDTLFSDISSQIKN